MKRWIMMLVATIIFYGCATPRPTSRAQSLSDQAFGEIKHENYDKAEKLLKEALELDPKHAFAWLNLGVVYQKQERYEDAKDCYLKVVENAWDEKGANKEADGRSLVRIARENLEKIPAH